MVRLQGPVVAALDAVFASDWFTESDEVLEVSVVPGRRAEGPGVLNGVPCQLVPSGPGSSPRTTCACSPRSSTAQPDVSR